MIADVLTEESLLAMLVVEEVRGGWARGCVAVLLVMGEGIWEFGACV